MEVTQGTLLVVFLVIFPGFESSSPLSICPESCTCQSDSLWNCSSADLSSPPQHLSNSITELDLSNNNPLGFLTLHSKYYNLQKVWLGNNSITHLSLCVDSGVGIKSVNRLRRGLRRLKKRGCVLWAPTLQLLSAERNQLEELPEGLGQQRSLQILQLSFNKISTLNPKDFSHLEQLKELHLQHNLITSLDPQIFHKLDKLKVVDVSFNMLTSLHPSTYVSLRDIGANVGMLGNRWTCDCKMRFLQRWMAYDSSRGLKTWSLVCALPSVYSGRDLLQLNEDDLECHNSVTNPESHQDITVYSGSDLLLTCFEQDASWWMPDGQVSRSQQQASLHISEIREQDAGLYVCVSESQHQVASIYNLQIRKTKKRQTRNTRSLPKQRISTLDSFTRLAQPRNVLQSNFDMAVSLSVIITFLIAFILGVLARPCICALWGKAKNKKNSSEATSVSIETSQRQYNNEAFEDLEDIEPHRERRVTFSTIDYSEEGNVKYYDTVAVDVQDGNAAVIGHGRGQANKESSDDSGSEHSNSEIPQTVVTNAGFTHIMEFERIPDSIEEGERKSLSSHSSHSSKADKILNCSTPNTTQAFEDHVQQTAIMPQTSIEVPGFKSGPFADWSPHLNNSSLINSDLENGEQFDFSDSVRSTSPRSPSSLNGSFKRPNLLVPASNNKVRYLSSSSSDFSDDEPTHYTVNPDPDEEHVETEVYNRGVASTNTSQDIRAPSSSSNSYNDSESLNAVESHWPVLDLEHIPCVKRRLDFKNIYVDSYSNEIIGKNEIRGPEQFLLAIDQKHPQIKKRRAPPPPTRKSSSSSDSEDEREKDLKHTQITKQDSKSVHFYQESHWPVINLERVSKVKRVLDIKVQCPRESPSSSDGDDERKIQPIKQYQENLHLPKSPDKESTTVHFNQDSQWPAIKLKEVGKVKRRLDIKALALESDSSSDSEVERTYQEATELPLAPINHNKVTAEKGHVDANPPKPESDTSSSSESEDETQGYTKKHDPKTHWPVLDLAKTRKIKRRLDIKLRTPSPESLSSSDSEDERQIKVVKQYQENLQQTTSPNKNSAGVHLDQESQWPVIDLVKVHKVKQRLDIKASLPPAGSSSSSDSEEERANLKVTQVQEKIPKPKSHTSSSSESEDETPLYTEKRDLKTPWPVVELENTKKVKRRLDIKVRSPPSESSSSDSEAERKIKGVKQYQENLQQATSPNKQSTTVTFDKESQWPAIDLAKVPKVKRRLDIKSTLQPAELSSNNDSEVEKLNLKVTQVQERIPKPKSQTSSSSEDETPRYTEKHDLKTNWPVLDLEYTSKIKRHLDVKVRSPPPEFYSSSDSEDEKEIKVVKQYKENLQQATSPVKHSAAVHLDQESQWPAIDLVKVPKIKRRLDIKAPLPPGSSSSSDLKVTQAQERVPSANIVYEAKPKSHTSSSSESEDETPLYTEKRDLKTPWPVVDLENTKKVKRRLDIKVRSPPSESSSSDSEAEREIKGVKQYQENLQQATSPNKQSTTVTFDEESQWPAPRYTEKHDLKTNWPVLDLKYTRKIKRRLDIKMRSPPSELSSSSEDEREIKVVKQYQENLQQATSPVKLSTAVHLDQESQWPAIDLVKVPKVKRRLDIKAPLPPAGLSSSSDSQDEEANFKLTQGQERVPSANIKAPKPHYDTSSSSRSEDETHHNTEKHDLETQWPVLDHDYTKKVKRRLDIKYQEQSSSAKSSSSSDTEDETQHYTNKREQVKVDVERSPIIATRWPVINLYQRVQIKRRLDFKAPSQSAEMPSTRDSGNETIHKVGITGFGSQVGSNEHWPIVDLDGITQLKRRLDFKSSSSIAEPLISGDSSPTSEIKVKDKNLSSSSSDEEEEVVTKLHSQVSAVPTSRWPELGKTSSSVPHISRRLDIKGPSLKSEPVFSSTTLGSRHSESSSSSEDENEKDKANLEIGASVKTTKGFIRVPKSPLPRFPQSPATSQNITLEKYTVVTDEFGNKSTTGSNSTTPEIPSELQSKWATMNLGVSRFRKRLDVMTRTNEPPSSPPPYPPDSPTSHRAIQSKQDMLATGSQYTESANVLETAAVIPPLQHQLEHSSSSESEQGGVDFKSSAVDPDSTWPQFSIPQVKRSLNITATLQSVFSSSSSEDEPLKLTAPDLSAGVPRLTRRLNFKAPTPPPSSASSSSEDESRFVHKFSDITDQHSIEYKRTIIKTFPYDSYSSSNVKNQWQTYREPQNVERGSRAPRKIPSLNFDNIKRKFRHSKQTLDGELPPNLRWTSVGSHLSEHPTPTLKRHHDGHLSPPPMSPPPVPKDVSSDSSGSESEEKLQEIKTAVIVTHKSSSRPGRVTFSSDKVLGGFHESPKSTNEILSATPKNKKGRGLSALKAMSSERRHWDTENFNETPPVNVDYTPQVNTIYQRSVDVKAQPQTYMSSASSDERRLANMLDGIPSYRRHIIKTTELPQGPPPPAPSTLPPDEAAELTWRSPQSTMKQSKESASFYVKQKNSKEEPPQDELYLDSPNISAV